MSLISLIVMLIVVGFLLWLLSLAPLDGTIKKIIWGIVIFATILWVLQGFGLLEPLRAPLFHNP